jgi:polyisoprenoid-binding protein YceI
MTDSMPATLNIDTNSRKIVASSYVVDSMHTRVLFKVRHFGVNNYWGEFMGPTGWLEIDPQRPNDTSLQLKVPTGQVRTNSNHLDEELRSAEWFDAERYRSIILAGSALELTSDSRAVFEGDFTLHGISKRVAFSIDFIGAGTNPFKGAPTIGFEASTTISRTEFGISAKYPIVGDRVEVIVSAAFDLA